MQEYTYLGTKITPTTSFASARQTLSNWTYYTPFLHYKNTVIIIPLSPKTASNIFYKKISPILLQN